MLSENGGIGVCVVHLERERSAQSVGGPGEFGYQRIAANLVGYSAVRFNDVGEPPERGLHAFVGDSLIGLDERSRANHVSVQYYRKFRGFTHTGARPERSSNSYTVSILVGS